MKNSGILFLAGLALVACGGNHRGEAQALGELNGAGGQALEKYRGDTAVRNVILVQCIGGSDALVQVYHKDDSIGTWTRAIETDGYIGRNGWTETKREGDGKSPVGDFGIVLAYGIKPDPGCAISYLDVTPDTYAIDGENEYYNLIVDANEAGTRDGEEMYAYSPEYNYGLALDYNRECEHGAGSNIFFHCKGAKPATGGCVAVDEDVMLQIMRMIRPGDRVCIYPQRKQADGK
ncbi:MAG: hypothetical protein NC102_06710 [Clostridium sp.]|nr:hypothetical protein [Clostridium sp.]